MTKPTTRDTAPDDHKMLIYVVLTLIAVVVFILAVNAASKPDDSGYYVPKNQNTTGFDCPYLEAGKYDSDEAYRTWQEQCG